MQKSKGKKEFKEQIVYLDIHVILNIFLLQIGIN